MADSNDTLGIKLTVQGRQYSMTIPRKDEEIYRTANKVVNAEVKKYIDSMPIISGARHDVALENEIKAITSACLNFATRFIKIANEYSESPVQKALRKEIDELESYIRESKKG
jgi:hypothetical protein